MGIDTATLCLPKLVPNHKSNKIIIKADDEKDDLFVINNFIEMFFDKIEHYVLIDTIKTYLEILSIDVTKLTFKATDSKEFQKLSNTLTKNGHISYQIYMFIRSKISKIEFFNMFSIEQIQYIKSIDTNHTKLIACAGSGKTRSIIGRIKFMAEHGLANPNEIFAITFSKHAAKDFHAKIKNLFPNHASFCVIKNFSTIDSLAKSILIRVKSHKSNNVGILSIALRNYLVTITDKEIELVKKFKNIKHLFVDEAQDLNEVQYSAIMLLNEKFGTNIHLIGDPNQNIYQFRRSNGSYLLDFPGRTFNLTLNFRSTIEIINFSECLKPVNTYRSVSGTGNTGSKVSILTNKSTVIHNLIIQFIKEYSNKKDISNIAIICPTRGAGSHSCTGLSIFFNLFKLNNIPFIQLYDESGQSDERKKIVKRVPGCVNLLTYHGTKGLEFEVVFAMDFYQFLFNIKPTYEEHNINRYLLYVAASRAISIMFVCTYTDLNSGCLNHWMTNVKPSYYRSDKANNAIVIPKLDFRDADYKPSVNGITQLIGELSDFELDKFHDLMKVDEDTNFFTRRIYPDYSQIDRCGDESLFGIFGEEVFYLTYLLSRRVLPRKFKLIEMIIETKFIVIDNESDCKMLKFHINLNNLSWDFYRSMKDRLPKKFCDLVEKHFDPKHELNESIVCTNDFTQIIGLNIEDIKKTYNRYLNPDSYDWNYAKILADMFYLVVVQYAYDNNHYHYISNHGSEKIQILQNGLELFEEIDKYVRHNYKTCRLDIKVNVKYRNMFLMGEIDFIEKYANNNETIVEIKCVKSLSIKYYIQLMLYNFCYYYNNSNNDQDILYSNKFKILNLLTGLEHYVIIKISPMNMFKLLLTLAQTGNLSFDKLNLVYDLETTDRIKQAGLSNTKLVGPNLECYFKDSKYYATVYPEIMEISIKDYDTGLVIMNTLVSTKRPPVEEVQKITNITPAMLKGKPTFIEMKQTLDSITKHFTNCNLMAHNGNSFDNKIMRFNKLFDPNKTNFLDTINIIPMHLPLGTKLESKSMGNLYQYFFGKKFIAHRAMNDVIALIKIMKHLKITF